MLPSQNGNDFLTRTHAFSVSDHTIVGEARRFSQNLCRLLDFDEVRQTRVSIIVTELGTNLVRYARDGKLYVRATNTDQGYGVEVTSVDAGPGLIVHEAMNDGFSSSVSQGTGLGAVRRQSDDFDIYSQSSGTVVWSLVHQNQSEHSTPVYKYGVINLPIIGEDICGDSWAVAIDGDMINVIVADGLGHGPMAYQASNQAVKLFTAQTQKSLNEQMQLIHNGLKGTRGGAIYLMAVSPRQITYTGVGNIRAILQTAELTKNFISQNGTAGLQIRTVSLMHQDWDGEGFIILHSDGLTNKTSMAAYPGLLQKHPSIAAGVLHRDFSRGKDDATIVVIKRNR